MNRRKKITGILTKKAKKANAKLQPKTKPRYISKAERAAMEAEASKVTESAADSVAGASAGEA